MIGETASQLLGYDNATNKLGTFDPSVIWTSNTKTVEMVTVLIAI